MLSAGSDSRVSGDTCRPLKGDQVDGTSVVRVWTTGKVDLANGMSVHRSQLDLVGGTNDRARYTVARATPHSHTDCPECGGLGYLVLGAASAPSEGYETGSYEPDECHGCDGTGNRFGLGHTLPSPEVAS